MGMTPLPCHGAGLRGFNGAFSSCAPAFGGQGEEAHFAVLALARTAADGLCATSSEHPGSSSGGFWG